jgi:hypothetical protein
MADSFDRKTALRIKINDLSKGVFVKSGGDFDPSFVRVNGREVNRVNLMGVVVEVSDLGDSLSIDDGTGIIEVRIFSNDLSLDFDIGDLINIIGKPREFNSQIFISCEVAKKVENSKWLELRKKELAKYSFVEPEADGVVDDAIRPEQDVEEEKLEQEPQTHDDGSPISKILCLVKDLDKGDGADFDAVVEESKLDNAEKVINNLLEEGELFEVKSGRLKVLE